MPHPTKIATCCYCGTRAALVLSGRERHELACSGCGAPLHDLKIMPSAAGQQAHYQRPLQAKPSYHKPKKSKKKNKKKKSPARKLFSEAFDLLDDIFD
ncbi:hypothetical protein PSA7680_00381 [Pseudoruegeria aquimaris]|uniref:Uncharacterized protein n=1 Tax=Pseudoruegeria aquimaris TaxID=393663 RepID=A0A1Y5RE59_9RHOB|nr:hypothetical protein [Pseudoruegeria aquimaris]SLN14957.1 hypothetical protein PSA7680_00381 [Pseudoruegeria aquimaris]